MKKVIIVAIVLIIVGLIIYFSWKKWGTQKEDTVINDGITFDPANVDPNSELNPELLTSQEAGEEMLRAKANLAREVDS